MGKSNQKLNDVRNKHHKMHTIVRKTKRALEGDDSQLSVESKKKGTHDQRCFYFPLCHDGAQSCNGWNQLTWDYFHPPIGNLPAGPRHHEWTEDAKEEKERIYKRETAERARKCMAKKRRMQSKK